MTAVIRTTDWCTIKQTTHILVGLSRNSPRRGLVDQKYS
jgi:hypothetical protein